MAVVLFGTVIIPFVPTVRLPNDQGLPAVLRFWTLRVELAVKPTLKSVRLGIGPFWLKVVASISRLETVPIAPLLVKVVMPDKT